MDIKTIEEDLKTGQVPPPKLAEYRDWLSGTSSSMMDRQLELQIKYAENYKRIRELVDSDKAALMFWQDSQEGKEEMCLDTMQKKIKVLLQAISSHLRVHENMARNIY